MSVSCNSLFTNIITVLTDHQNTKQGIYAQMNRKPRIWWSTHFGQTCGRIARHSAVLWSISLPDTGVSLTTYIRSPTSHRTVNTKYMAHSSHSWKQQHATQQPVVFTYTEHWSKISNLHVDLLAETRDLQSLANQRTPTGYNREFWLDIERQKCKGQRVIRVGV